MGSLAPIRSQSVIGRGQLFNVALVRWEIKRWEVSSPRRGLIHGQTPADRKRTDGRALRSGNVGHVRIETASSEPEERLVRLPAQTQRMNYAAKEGIDDLRYTVSS